MACLSPRAESTALVFDLHCPAIFALTHVCIRGDEAEAKKELTPAEKKKQKALRAAAEKERKKKLNAPARITKIEVSENSDQSTNTTKQKTQTRTTSVWTGRIMQQRNKSSENPYFFTACFM